MPNATTDTKSRNHRYSNPKFSFVLNNKPPFVKGRFGGNVKMCGSK